MRRPVLLVLTLVTLPLLALSCVAHADDTPAQICAGAKLKATGKAAGASVSCHAKAAQKGIASDPGCLAKADTKLGDAFAKAEARGGCATTGDIGRVEALLDSSVGAFVAALRPVTSANRCAGAKLKAMGKKAKTKLGCQAKATGRGLAVDPECLTRAEARFAAAFAKAEARPPCLTTGDASAIESLVDGLVDGAVASLPSVTTSTTTTTTTTTTTLNCAPDGTYLGGFPGFPCCSGGVCQPIGPSACACGPGCEASTFPMCGGPCYLTSPPQPLLGCIGARIITTSGTSESCGCPPAGIVCDPPCPCPAGQVCQFDFTTNICGCVPL